MKESADACSIEWLLIPAPDLEKAKNFYHKVFGFAISLYSDSFALFKAANISGGLDSSLSPSVNSLSFSVTVSSIDKYLTEIERFGGRIIKSKYPLGTNLGFCARFSDPNGNILELYSDK